MRIGDRMLRCIRQIERDGRTDLLEYITAFNMARAYMGEKIPGPFGERGYKVRLLAICLVGHAMNSEGHQQEPSGTP